MDEENIRLKELHQRVKDKIYNQIKEVSYDEEKQNHSFGNLKNNNGAKE